MKSPHKSKMSLIKVFPQWKKVGKFDIVFQINPIFYYFIFLILSLNLKFAVFFSASWVQKFLILS